jgi:uncharacterized RDD family membrane protein YckC
MIRCTTCGTESEDGTTDCAHCGSPLTPLGPTSPPPPWSGLGAPEAVPPPPGYPVGNLPASSFGPPASYGPPPGYGQPGPYGPAPGGFNPQQGALASWGPRALGYLIDAVPVVIVVVIAVVLGGVSEALGLLIRLVAIAIGIWFSVQVGQTGQSPGMRVVGLRCIGIQTGQPIGGGLGFVRSLAHIVDSLICYVGWLFPLWDSQRQTLADKIMKTVVVVVPTQGFSLTPPTT